MERKVYSEERSAYSIIESKCFYYSPSGYITVFTEVLLQVQGVVVRTLVAAEVGKQWLVAAVGTRLVVLVEWL